MSRLKAVRRAVCQLKIALQGFVSSGSNVRVEVEGPLKGGLSTQKGPSSNVRVKVEGPSKGGLSTLKSPSRVRVPEATYA